jgi:uncharacterized protein (DUF2147 family)
MMQKMIFLFVAVFLSMNAFTQSSNDKILGKWVNKEKTKTIEFVKTGNEYEAIIRSAEDKKLIGKKQITGLQKDGANSFKNGTIHLYKRNTTAQCSAKLVSSSELSITGKVGLMSKTESWIKL